MKVNIIYTHTTVTTMVLSDCISVSNGSMYLILLSVIIHCYFDAYYKMKK